MFCINNFFWNRLVLLYKRTNIEPTYPSGCANEMVGSKCAQVLHLSPSCYCRYTIRFIPIFLGYFDQQEPQDLIRQGVWYRQYNIFEKRKKGDSYFSHRVHQEC